MHQYSSSTPLVLGIILFLVVESSVTITVTATSNKECAESVTGLAMCLPYVVGTAKSPTPDCCGVLKQVLRTSKKCLCLLIKDRNDPDLGLDIINVTLALSLPRACATPANFEQCSALLGLYPNSPDAQFFYQLGKNASITTNISPSPSSPIPTAMGVANPAHAPLGGGGGGVGDGSTRKSGGCSNTRIQTLLHTVTIVLLYACLLNNSL